MRTFLRNIVATVVLLMSLIVNPAKGQTGSVYPVDLNVMLAPPFGTCLTDLTNTNRFVIQALLRDMNHGNDYQMVIQMRVKSLSSLNTVFLSHTKPFSIGMGKPTVVLSANNSTVSISDFFDEANILALPGSVRLNNNCLPEGSYMFCFQAFDAMAYFGGQRIPISKEFALTAFMEDGAAPILLSPRNNDSIPCMALDINFMWQQPFVTSGLNTYTLQIAEVTDKDHDSPQVLETGVTQEYKGLMVPMQNVHVTEAKFQENHTYYWRVIMCDKNGTPRYNYPNKGASPAYRFVYCGTPQEPEPEDPWEQKVPQAKAIGKGLDTLRMDSVRVDEATTCTAIWFKDSVEVREKYDGVIIEVKKTTQDTWTPFKLESTVRTDTTIELSSLSYNDSFMVRGQYYMLEEGKPVYAPYSDTVYFRIKHPADTVDCGAPVPELTDCSGSGERSEFRLGDRFSANGTSVTIDSIISQKVNGSSLTLTGIGHIPFPILSNFGLKVSFTDVEINCDDQLKRGKVISVYDEKTAAMIDLNNLIGKGNKGNDLGQSDAILNDGDGDVSNLGEGDVILNGNNITMKDTAGNEISVGTIIDLSSSSVYSDNTSLKDSKVYIKFSNPDYENIAFDDDDQKLRNSSFTLADNYRDFGGGYIIPWVASNPGRKFQLKATPSDNFKTEGYTDVKFVIPASSGKHIELESEANGDDYMVSIPGISTNKQSTVYAIARKSADSPYENVGKLNLCCYTFKTKRLVIVPLVEGITVSASEVKTALEKIYGKLGYTFEVEVDNAHSNGVRKSIALESTVMSEFSSDMKEVINGYKANIDADASYSYDKSAAYLFLMEKPEGSFSETKGIMPQKQQFGFIFMQGSKSVTTAETHTMAHELGHGLFGLDHVFIKSYGITEGSTHNLMDYTKNTPDDFLSYHEWSQINSPVMSWSLFNSDEGNMDVVYVDILAPVEKTDYNHAIDPNGDLIYYIKSQDPNLTLVLGCGKDYRSLKTFWLYKKGSKEDIVATYKWNSNLNTYVDEDGKDIVNDKRILLQYNKNKNPQRVCVYSSTADKCIVKSAIITYDPVKKEIPLEITNWETQYTFSAGDDCFNEFYEDIFVSDRKCKNADAGELAALKRLNSESPASEVERTVNGCTQCSLRELGYDRIINLFKILAIQEKIDDHSEFAILRLMSVIRDENYADFFNTLEANNNELIINLVKEMHDKIPYFTVAAEIVNGYKEGDNYTHFIAALCTMVRQRPATLGLRLNALDDLPVFLEETPYEGLQFGFLSILNKYRYNFSYDETTGNLKPYKESSSYSLYANKILADLVYRLISGEDNYVFDEFLGGSVSPLTPVIILPGSSKDLMTVALSDEKMKEGTVYVVPALFFKYVKDKIFAKTIENGVTVALDVATIVGSGGAALSTKVHWAKRIWACVELSSVLCDVVLMSDVIQNKELKSYIETYNNIVGFISFAKDISSGLSKMDKSKNIQKEIVENTENTGAAVKERIENGAIDCLEKSEDIDVSKLSTDEINSYKKVAEVIKTVVAPKTSGKWTEYVGKNIDDLTTAPEGYCIYSRNGKKWIRRLDVTDKNTPRLTVVEETENGAKIRKISLLIKNEKFDECLKKYSNIIGTETASFTSCFADASDAVLNTLLNNKKIVESWSSLNKIGISIDILKNTDALKAWKELKTSHSIDKINESVKDALTKIGLGDEDLSKLIELNRRASFSPDKYPDEVKICQQISEKCFPLPKEGETITKLVSESDFFDSDWYFRNTKEIRFDDATGTSVSGCIAKKSEFSMSNASLDDIIKYFGLDYKGNKFERANGYVKMEIVTTSDMTSVMTRPAIGMKNPERPQTLTGILGHQENKDLLTPEYYLTGRCGIPDKSIATHFNKDGSVNIKYEYDKKTYRWLILDNGDEASGLCKGLNISKEPFEAFRDKLKTLGSKSKDFYNDFKNAPEEIRMQFVNDFELIDNWAFCKGIHPNVAKDIEALKHLKELRNLEKSKGFGFTDDFLKEMKQAHSSVAPSWKQIWTSCENFMRNFDKKDIENLEYVLGDLKKESNFMVGAEWTLRYVGDHADEFAGKKLWFEQTEDIINSTSRRVDLKVIYIENGENIIDFYEFKSVQDIPPGDFFKQFGKDLLNGEVKEVSQLNWIFDGKKVTQEQLVETMKKTIEEWDIPDAVLNKWEKLGYSKNKLKEAILSIFKVD